MRTLLALMWKRSGNSPLSGPGRSRALVFDSHRSPMPLMMPNDAAFDGIPADRAEAAPG
jgi:hypothetical protein